MFPYYILQAGHHDPESRVAVSCRGNSREIIFCPEKKVRQFQVYTDASDSIDSKESF